jgi:D-alanyl-D-alanine dipeptidase
MKHYLMTVLFLAVILPSTSVANTLPDGFVYLHTVDATIRQKLDLATSENFVGCPVDGYEGNQVICTKALAEALKRVQTSLKKSHPHYSLRISDAYRPTRAAEHFQRWAKDLSDQKTKAKYYPHIDKKDLLGTYIAAKKSAHSRGSTVDLEIEDVRSGDLLDFGPTFFGDFAHYDYKDLTKKQRENRLMLRELMLAHGFKPYDAEFWHFTLKDEPFPNEFFDFPIKNLAS